jgi:1,4-dihydroxy-2-naphthoyl-CoA hydrolase
VGAATEGKIVATATALHVGSTTIIVETEMRAGDRLIAKTTQTQIVRKKR